MNGLESSPEYLELFSALTFASPAREEREEVAMLRRALAHPAESLRLLALPRVRALVPTGEAAPADPDEQVRLLELRAELLLELYQRTGEEGESEGVVWTPVMDRLSTEVKGAYAESRLASVQTEALRLSFRPEPLLAWLEQVRDPGELEPLAAFSSRILLSLVARHAGALDERWLERLRRDAGAGLLQNPALSPEMRKSLLAWAWRSWDDPLSEDPETAFDCYDRNHPAGSLLRLAARTREGLPAEIRQAMHQAAGRYARAENRWKDVIWPVVLEDGQLGREEIREVVAHQPEKLSTYVVGSVLRHPNAPAELLAQLQQEFPVGKHWLRSGAERALEAPNSPFPLEEERLRLLLQALLPHTERDPYFDSLGKPLFTLLKDPAVREEHWGWILEWGARVGGAVERRILEVLSAVPEAWRKERMRRALQDARYPEGLVSLFPIPDPEVYAEVLTALWRAGGEGLAYGVLQQYPVPAGTRIEEGVLSEMLSSSQGRDRLLVISSLAQLRSPEPPVHQEVPGRSRGRVRG